MARPRGRDAEQGQRRILLASYYFPPDAAVGGLRIAKFARFLPDFGWHPLVITVRDEYREQGFDEGRLEGLDGVPTFRTHELPRVWRRLKGLLRWLPGRPQASVVTGDQARRTRTTYTPRHETVVERVKRWLISLTVLLPDEKKHWAGRAAFTAVGLIRRMNVQYVLTSGPPFSTHFIGLMAVCFTKAAWIADFRDPWIDMLPDRVRFTRSRLSDFMERWMELLVAKSADQIVLTTPRMLEAFRARYPSIDRNRFVCVSNGIDADRFASVPEVKPTPLTITYTGSLYFDRTPEPLFRAVSDLLGTGRITRGDICIQLVGKCGAIEGTETRTVVHQYGLDGIVHVLEPIPYDEAIRFMRRSHLVLVLAPKRHRLVVPAKIYDYLGSGSAVLAIAEDGATADLIAETGCGRCFSEADVDGLREYLGGLIEDGSFRTLGNKPTAFVAFDARRLAGTLAAIMDAKVGNASRQVVVEG